MVLETVNGFAGAAAKKVAFLNKSVLRYFLLSLLAGVYVGLGIVLIFSIGGPLATIGAPALKALMGASFAVALILVLFAGSELFTGNNMILTIGSLTKKTSWLDTIKLWVVCYAGNLAGALVLAGLIAGAGMFASSTTDGNESLSFITKVALAKGTAPFLVLFIKAILCNVLVCLAVWTTARTTNDMAKLMLIFWCLFAFIGSGYEHSIANMTVIGIGVFVSESVTWGHFWANMLPVTLGNMVGGIGLGAIYWFISNKDSVEA
jgi:nitrite transporter NirC